MKMHFMPQIKTLIVVVILDMKKMVDLEMQA
jgi:hypothetical protein